MLGLRIEIPHRGKKENALRDHLRMLLDVLGEVDEDGLRKSDGVKTVFFADRGEAPEAPTVRCNLSLLRDAVVRYRFTALDVFERLGKLGAALNLREKISILLLIMGNEGDISDQLLINHIRLQRGEIRYENGAIVTKDGKRYKPPGFHNLDDDYSEESPPLLLAPPALYSWPQRSLESDYSTGHFPPFCPDA